MLTNAELTHEFNLFADIWTMFKYFQPVSHRQDVEYWDEVNQRVIDIMHKYPGEFSQELALVVLGELERRRKNNENQNAGSK